MPTLLAAPPNTTPATAIDVGALPVALTIDVSALPGGGVLWYRYTAGLGEIVVGFGAVAAPSSTYALVSVYRDAGLTLYLGLAGLGRGQMPVTPGAPYYLQISAVPGGSTSVALTLTRAPNVAVPAGSLLVNDDAAGFPLAVLSPTDGTPQQFRPFPSGENADVLPPTGVSLWADHAAGTLQLFDATLTRQATLPWTFTGDPPITSNRVDRFYIGDPGGGATPARVTSVTAAGAMGAMIWTLPSAGLVALAVSRDETVLYHYGQTTGAGAIQRWDLLHNVPLPPLAAGVAGFANRKTLLVLADETILVPYTPTAAPWDGFVRRYARDGTLLHTYPFPAVVVNHVAHALDDPASFWVWAFLRNPSGTPNGFSRFDRVRVSDGTILTSAVAAQYEGGAYQPATPPPPAPFGHSSSCPFVVFPPALAAYGPPGGGGGSGGGSGGTPVPPSAGWGTFPPIPPGRIRRVRRAPHLSAELVEQFFARLQLEFEAGVGNAVDPGADPQIYLRWSDDGGHTWRAPLAVSAGTAGAFRRRAIWRRLGRARDRVFEVSMSDPVKWALLAASLDAATGTS